MATERSGRPLWGLQTCCWGSGKPTLTPVDLCFWKLWSMYFSLVVFVSPLLLLVPVAGEAKSSPKAFLMCLSWSVITFFRQRKCLATVFKAKETYGVAELRPTTDSNDETTICICWWYCLYLLQTFQIAPTNRKSLHFLET